EIDADLSKGEELMFASHRSLGWQRIVSRSAHRPADSSEQFLGAEGLCDVVIRPKLRSSTLSSTCTSALSTTTGTDAARLLNARHSSLPGIRGSLRSSTTTLGIRFRNISRPATPSGAISTASPSEPNRRCRVLCIGRLSSTTNTLSIGPISLRVRSLFQIARVRRGNVIPPVLVFVCLGETRIFNDMQQTQGTHRRGNIDLLR